VSNLAVGDHVVSFAGRDPQNGAFAEEIVLESVGEC